MAIVTFDPFKQLEAWQKALDDLWGQPTHTASQALTTPVSDVYTEGEGDKQTLVVEAHLPNFHKEEVDININEGMLEIRADHREKEEDKKKRRYVLRESTFNFYRRIGLPKNIDTSKIKADFNEGVLRIKVPFKELPKPKKIAIESTKK
jgi:HSP20 family protein